LLLLLTANIFPAVELMFSSTKDDRLLMLLPLGNFVIILPSTACKACFPTTTAEGYAINNIVDMKSSKNKDVLR